MGHRYDMSKVVDEQKNEYNQHPEIVAKLTALLEKYVAEGRSTPGVAQTNDVPVSIVKKRERRRRGRSNSAARGGAVISGQWIVISRLR